MKTETLVEALRKALTWEGRLNEADQLMAQGKAGQHVALDIRGGVHAERKEAEKAIAAADRLSQDGEREEPDDVLVAVFDRLNCIGRRIDELEAVAHEPVAIPIANIMARLEALERAALTDPDQSEGA